MSTNTWVGVGNLTKDPEMRISQGQNQTTICRFSIAINDGYGDKQEVNYINIVAFGKTADSCGNYLTKGKKVAVTGRIKTGSYENKQGQKVYTTDIIASSVEFLTPNQQNQPENWQQSNSGFEQGKQDNGPGFGQQQPAWSNQWQSEQQNMFGQPQEQPQGFAALRTDDVPF